VVELVMLEQLGGVVRAVRLAQITLEDKQVLGFGRLHHNLLLLLLLVMRLRHHGLLLLAAVGVSATVVVLLAYVEQHLEFKLEP